MAAEKSRHVHGQRHSFRNSMGLSRYFAERLTLWRADKIKKIGKSGAERRQKPLGWSEEHSRAATMITCAAESRNYERFRTTASNDTNGVLHQFMARRRRCLCQMARRRKRLRGLKQMLEDAYLARSLKA